MLFIFLLTTLMTSPFTASLGLASTAVIARVLLLRVGVNWFFFALIILFVGGIIVLFMYICSLTRSLKIESNKILVLAAAATLSGFFGFNQELVISSSKLEGIVINNLFRSISFAYLIFLAIYLLMGLVVVISLTNKFVGPLKNRILYDK